jgi:hypothetical protein
MNHHVDPYRIPDPPSPKSNEKPVEKDVVCEMTILLITVDGEKLDFVVGGDGDAEGEYVKRHDRDKPVYRDAKLVYECLLREAYEAGFLAIPNSDDTIPWHQIKRLRVVKTESKVIRWVVKDAVK